MPKKIKRPVVIPTPQLMAAAERQFITAAERLREFMREAMKAEYRTQ